MNPAKIKASIINLWHDISLVPKILFLTIFLGAVLWGLQNYILTKQLRNISNKLLVAQLTEKFQEDRIRFDRFLTSFPHTSKLICTQVAIQEHVRNLNRTSGDKTATRHYYETPPWLPDNAVIRSLTHIDYAFLIDERGAVREIYHGAAKPPPQALLQPSARLIQQSNNVSFLTYFDAIPFLVVSSPIRDFKGDTSAVLIIAAQINSDFLMAASGLLAGSKKLALLEGEDNPVIIASSRPDRLPEGSSLESVKKTNIVMGKAFFDKGESEVVLQLVSIISKNELADVNTAILKADQFNRLGLSLVFILISCLIGISITRNIRRLSQKIASSSLNGLHLPSAAINHGDELIILNEQFDFFAKEIVKGRADLIIQMEGEKEKIATALQEALSDIKILRGVFPICASCKMIRDDKGEWIQIESYIKARSEAEFSHGICPACTKKLYPEYYDAIFDEKNK